MKGTPYAKLMWISVTLVAGLIGLAPAARAADDTRFYGAWETTFPYEGQTLTLVSVHSSSGYKNYVLLPEGSMPVGQGSFSAANGQWSAAADKPNDSGTYQFIDNDDVRSTNAAGQAVTWKRHKGAMPPVIGTGAVYPSHVSATMATVLAGARKQWKKDAEINRIELQWYPPQVPDASRAYWLRFEIYSPSIRSTCRVNVGGPINGNTFCGNPNTNPIANSSTALPPSFNLDLPDFIAFVRHAGMGGPLGSVELRMAGATGTPSFPAWTISVVGGPAWAPLFVNALDGKVVAWQRAMDPPNGNDAQLADIYGIVLQNRGPAGGDNAAYKAMECVVEIQETGNCAQ
jgi:hypothetical protein